MFVNLYRGEALVLLSRHRVQGVDGVGVGELVELEVLHGVDQHALVQLLSQSEVSIAAPTNEEPVLPGPAGTSG